jgi:hypothetical protein
MLGINVCHLQEQAVILSWNLGVLSSFWKMAPELGYLMYSWTVIDSSPLSISSHSPSWRASAGCFVLIFGFFFF